MERLDAPKITEHGTSINAALCDGSYRDGKAVWTYGAPSLYDLRCLRTPKFSWDKDAHEIFFFALVGHSHNRRIRDSHKGLFEEAARNLVRHASNMFADELKTAGVFCWQQPVKIDEAVAEIVAEMRSSSSLKEICEKYTKTMLAIVLSDADLTNGNYLLSVSDRNPLRIDPDEGIELLNELRKNDQPIMRQINRALDVIDVYTRSKERLPYVQLEMFLTSTRRVVYAVHNRAY
jgi:hypothetical protein